MKDNSGFGFDPIREIPTCSDEVWEEFVKVHKDAAKFRRAPFMWFQDMDEILTGDMKSSL